MPVGTGEYAVTSVAAVSVSLSPTTVVASGTITATYGGLQPDTPAWICFQSGSDAIADPPTCGNPGEVVTISGAGAGSSGGGSAVCTPSTTSGAAVDLTWDDVTQSNIRVRACTSLGDASQANNPNRALHQRKCAAPLHKARE